MTVERGGILLSRPIKDGETVKPRDHKIQFFAAQMELVCQSTYRCAKLSDVVIPRDVLTIFTLRKDTPRGYKG